MSKGESKSGKRRVIALGALLGGAALVYVVAAPRPVTVEVATAERGALEETIRADGVLRSKERYVVQSPADGDIKRIALDPGDPVEKGQPITELFWDVKYEPVRAPISGVISKVFRESAGPVRRGEPLVEIVDPSRLEVMAELLTTDAARVRPGDAARIEGWGGAGTIPAAVSRISKAGYVKQSALGVEEEKTEVILEPRGMPPGILARVGNNFHVEATIQVSVHEGVLKIPVGAIFRDGEKWAVFRDEGGRARKARIEIGARSERDVEVVDGLAPGERVVVYPGDRVREGARLAPEDQK